MNSISVHADIDYQVLIDTNWREFVQSIDGNHKKILFVAPVFIAEAANLMQLCKSANRFLFVTPDGETQKDFFTVERLWNILGEQEFGRTDAIIAIGGGATTDLVGFVAATWLRGIAWYAIPTTLAGMVDASVGGKTGINTSAGKNLVGSFYSPRAVCADMTWLSSLSDRDFSAGLAEVIKTGCISDLSILDLLDAVPSVMEARTFSAKLVTKSVAVKATVVSADFKEGRLREILNFGHTLGHAIEKQSAFTLRHGEAVAIGLHYAALLSESVLEFTQTERIVNLIAKFNLPSSVAKGEFEWSDLFGLMTGDKKSRDGRIRFVGLKALGEPDWIETASPELLHATYGKIVR